MSYVKILNIMWDLAANTEIYRPQTDTLLKMGNVWLWQDDDMQRARQMFREDLDGMIEDLVDIIPKKETLQSVRDFVE